MKYVSHKFMLSLVTNIFHFSLVLTRFYRGFTNVVLRVQSERKSFEGMKYKQM